MPSPAETLKKAIDRHSAGPSALERLEKAIADSHRIDYFLEKAREGLVRVQRQVKGKSGKMHWKGVWIKPGGKAAMPGTSKKKNVENVEPQPSSSPPSWGFRMSAKGEFELLNNHGDVMYTWPRGQKPTANYLKESGTSYEKNAQFNLSLGVISSEFPDLVVGDLLTDRKRKDYVYRIEENLEYDDKLLIRDIESGTRKTIQKRTLTNYDVDPGPYRTVSAQKTSAPVTPASLKAEPATSEITKPLLQSMAREVWTGDKLNEAVQTINEFSWPKALYSNLYREVMQKRYPQDWKQRMEKQRSKEHVAKESRDAATVKKIGKEFVTGVWGAKS